MSNTNTPTKAGRKYYSIRVVNALNKQKAIELVKSEKFDNEDNFCDQVLTDSELINVLAPELKVGNKALSARLQFMKGAYEALSNKNAELLEALKIISGSTPRTNKKGMIFLNELTALQALANSAIAKAEGKE